MLKKILLGLLSFIILLLAGGYGYYRLFIYHPPLISEEDRAATTLMPLPAKLELQKGSMDLSEGFNINYTNFADRHIGQALDRLISRIEQKTSLNVKVEGGYDFRIKYSEAILLDSIISVDDEAYTLKVSKNKIELTAPTQIGILRGFETILQLVNKKGGQWVLPHCKIEDKPRFAWRGVMLDVCRHWMPKGVVLRTIDAMATAKMNVFHWHLSEDQGFRIESKIYPKLHEIGSNGKYYTQAEIKEVIQFAADRGIRIVPEFDLPGHSKSWQIAYPELSSVDYPLTFGSKRGELFAPPLDPTKDSVYLFLDQFIGEMAELFPDNYFHIGGDEVNPDYWNKNPEIVSFMKEEGLEDTHDLQAYFNKRMYGILAKHGKLMLGWDEILHPDLGKDIIVQSWRSHKSLFEAVQRGGTAVLSAGYYMDHVLPAEKHYKIDPTILEGAVDITPDTTQWQMYNLRLDIAGNEMESQIVIFDRDPEDVFGFFAMMDGRTAFKDGTFIDNQLEFTFDGPAGKMEYKAELMGDSLIGKLSLGILSFGASGSKVGGSDLPGTQMPTIEVMKPLTDDEKSRIIGGEACQWAEFVDSTNVESRIWPRTAAIAEKLWSSQELTSDIDDMYRRLSAFSNQLTIQGLHHDIQYETKLKSLVKPGGLVYLKNLTDYLEEVKYHGRMPSLMETDSIYLPDFPLDRIVDAVRPESMAAREFNLLVEKYSEENSTEQKRKIIDQLKVWQYNHELLSQYFNTSEKLEDIEDISLELSKVAADAIAILDNRETTLNKELLLNKLSFLETGENGVILAVVPGLRKIVLTQ